MSQNEFQKMSFQIISYAGTAYSLFLKAIESARQKNYENAKKLLQEGEESLTGAHQAQTNLLVKEARGENVHCSVIMIHAQDHLMNAVLLKELAREFIMMYEENGGKKDD